MWLTSGSFENEGFGRSRLRRTALERVASKFWTQLGSQDQRMGGLALISASALCHAIASEAGAVLPACAVHCKSIAGAKALIWQTWQLMQLPKLASLEAGASVMASWQGCKALDASIVCGAGVWPKVLAASNTAAGLPTICTAIASPTKPRKTVRATRRLNKMRRIANYDSPNEKKVPLSATAWLLPSTPCPHLPQWSLCSWAV
jgi:hypothetical protein